MDLTTCPQCGEAAEIFDRHVLDSTDGPVELDRVRCVQKHLFFMPVDGLRSAGPVDVRRRHSRR